MTVHVLSKLQMPGDLLRVSDLSAPQLGAVLDLAAEMRSDPTGWVDAYPGTVLVCHFARPSAHTRVSFEAAGWRLGMLPATLRPDELQLGRGEPIADTGRVLSGYASAIVTRTFEQADVEALAAAATVPVINALTNEHHPCQALADLLTLRDRFGSLRGLKLAYVGNANNVACSLMEAGALAGMHVAIAAPDGYLPPVGVVGSALETARDNGGSLSVGNELTDAVRDADAVYTDAWGLTGHDAEHDRRLLDLQPFQVNAGVMDSAAPDAVFMHCLPAHRGQEVAAEVIDGPRSIAFEQAQNRLPIEQAVIHALLCATLPDSAS